MTIGLLLLAGLTLIFVNSSEANRELQKTAQQIENGRYAIDVITQDLKHAGYYGHFHGTLPAPAALPDPCETADTAKLKEALAYPAQGYRAASLVAAADVSATTCDTALLTAANLKAGSDILVVRRANTTAISTAAASAVANEVYIQATGTQLEVQVGSAAMVLNGKASGGGSDWWINSGTPPTLPAPIRKLHTHVYFVAPCSVGSGAGGVCQAGDDTIPTLKRLELGVGPAMTIVPLVEGIEYLKIEYGIDTWPGTVNPSTELVGDATVDSFAAVPAAWEQVIAAKVYLLARNIEPTSGYTDDKTYTLGSVGVPAANDRIRRHVYSAAVRLMNASGRREIP
ncbi:MAG TPA: PilW family protein [Mycobacterium sp.]